MRGKPSGFLTGCLFGKSLSQSEKGRCASLKRRSGRGQKRRKGGSDPTLFGFQPPKNPWDRSRPLLKPLARVHAPEQTFCNARRDTNLTRKGEKRCVTSESAIETTKDYKSSSPFGGRSQTQCG